MICYESIYCIDSFLVWAMKFRGRVVVGWWYHSRQTPTLVSRVLHPDNPFPFHSSLSSLPLSTKLIHGTVFHVTNCVCSKFPTNLLVFFFSTTTFVFSYFLIFLFTVSCQDRLWQRHPRPPKPALYKTDLTYCMLLTRCVYLSTLVCRGVGLQASSWERLS